MVVKVSVVISAYQKATLLPRTLQSVLDQTFRDFEVIVVDDGSTDNTREVVQTFAERDSRVRYIYQENQGPGGARNTGIHNAQADLIALLDGDDTWFPDKLTYQVRLMDAFPEIDLLFTNSNYVSDIQPDRVVERSDYYHDYVMSVFDLKPLEGIEGAFLIMGDDFAGKLLQKNVINLSTVMLRKSLFVRTGGFALHLRGPEDADFWVRAALRGHQFAYSSRKCATYFKNPGSLVNVSKESTVLEQLKYAVYVYESAEYESVRNIARVKVRQRYRDLIVFHSNNHQPRKAWGTLRESLAYGVDIRNIILAISAFGGPLPLRVYRRLRQSLSGATKWMHGITL